MQMKMTEAQRDELLANRVNSTVRNGKRKYDRRGRDNKRRIYGQIRKDHGLLPRQKLVFFLDNPDNPLYMVLRDKVTRIPLDDGKAPPAPQLAPPVAAEEVEDNFDFEAEFNDLLQAWLDANPTTEAAKPEAIAKVQATIAKVAAQKLPLPVAKKATLRKVVAKKAAPVKAPTKSATAAKKVVIAVKKAVTAVKKAAPAKKVVAKKVVAKKAAPAKKVVAKK